LATKNPLPYFVLSVEPMKKNAAWKFLKQILQAENALMALVEMIRVPGFAQVILLVGTCFPLVPLSDTWKFSGFGV